MPASPAPVHFSMIRGFHVADLFTLANGACGVGALFLAMTYVRSGRGRDLYLAALLVPVAIVFDFLDGRVARWRHSASAMGREMDSLADVISFGVAPAGIAFAAGLVAPLDVALLIYFAGCGLSRLARYNVTAEMLSGGTGKVPYFEGTPITFSLLPLAALILAFRHGDLFALSLLGVEVHAPALLFAISGNFMISKTIRIPKP